VHHAHAHACAHVQRVRATPADGPVPSSNGLPSSNGHSPVPGNNGHSNGHSHGHGHSGHGSLADEMSQIQPGQLADTLWAWVLSKGYDPAVFGTVCQVVSQDPRRFDAPSLVSVLSAAAEVGHVDPECIRAAAARLSEPGVLVGVDTGNLAQLGWSLALLAGAARASGEGEEVQALLEEKLLGVLGRQAARVVTDFAADDLARLLAAFGELRFTPPLLMDAASLRLTDTLIPLAQLSPAGLAQVCWAYARLGVYDRGMVDAAHSELTRRADRLAPESVSQAAWAATTIRSHDEKHRQLHDVNLLHALAGTLTSQLTAAREAQKSVVGSPSPSTSSSDATAAGAPDGPQQQGPAVPVTSLVNVLLAFASVSHHDSPLFGEAARYLALNAEQCSPQDVVIASYAYSRVKHKAPALLEAMAARAAPLLGQLDEDDLTYLATWGAGAAGTLHAPLVRAVVERALYLIDAGAASGGPPLIGPTALLDLARCVAAVQHLDEPFFSAASPRLLRGVNAGLTSTDMEGLRPTCGSTDPSGLHK